MPACVRAAGMWLGSDEGGVGIQLGSAVEGYRKGEQKADRDGRTKNNYFC